MTKNALVIGGTSGIGKATADKLLLNGYFVTRWGRRDYNVYDFDSNPLSFLKGQYDLIIYSPGDLKALWSDAFKFSMAFYYLIVINNLLAVGGLAIAVSSVAAHRPAKVNPHYAAAKAALESYCLTLSESSSVKSRNQCVSWIGFDLVETPMLKDIPAEFKTNRIITASEAADAILSQVEELL